MGEDFKLKVSPRMLELLSRDLYTNIYFVLAELIANAYDADAENVYVFIDEEEIRVEDDGVGMTAAILDEQYLVVGAESRNKKENSTTLTKKRLKMGRKGVGKLAALSISDGFKLVTMRNRSKVGVFVPHRIEHDDELLHVLTEDEYALKRIQTNGTAVIMENPKITIPKLQSTVMNNLSKIFPNDISDFVIHIIYKGNEKILVPDEKAVVGRLASLMTIGDEKVYLNELLPNDSNIQKKHVEEIVETISMKNNDGIETSLSLKIYGWIGTYKTSRGMKKEINEFSDNYLAIFAHNKMGLRNVLPIIGKNRVYESYIVGNLYIDAFEASEFPDMAGTNRQGYNENDPRWEHAKIHMREITDEIVKMHQNYAKLEQEEREREKLTKQKKREEQLNKTLTKVTAEMKRNLSSKLSGGDKADENDINKIVDDQLNNMRSLLGLKATVDADKKKIMISHTFKDKQIADVVYAMLLYNNVPKEDIIYSNGPDPETNLPEKDIYGYLRDFFVQSASSEMIYVMFVTSKNVVDVDPKHPAVSWGELMEIGACWVTQKDHWIFNINDFKPESPLNIEDKWVAIYTKKGDDDEVILSLSEAMVNSFCTKILETCLQCGYTPKPFEDNKNYIIKNYVEVYSGS